MWFAILQRCTMRKTNTHLINDQIRAQKKKKKFKLPVDLLRALFSLVQYPKAHHSQAVHRSAALKGRRRKRSLPARCHISIWELSGGLKRSLWACVDSLEGPKICASTCASARDELTSLRQQLPAAFKTRATLHKRVALQPGGESDLKFRPTTFKSADIFRNRSMSLC